MISSGSNQQIKDLMKLQKNGRYRRKQRCFIVEGIKLTKEALFNQKLQKVYVSESFYRDNQVEEFAEIPLETVTDQVFCQICDTVTPQGILGIVSFPEYSLEEILSDERTLYLLLDDVRDPGNLGTIIRTAEGAGMSGVILSRECVDLLNPKVVRSTMGAIFRVPFVYVDSLEEVIDTMKAQGIGIYGTCMEGSSPYDKVDYCKPSGMVIGNEANGISNCVMDRLTGKISIPMDGKLESLNAAVAAALVMYEAARQRRNRSSQYCKNVRKGL